jgi:VanZ family protein
MKRFISSWIPVILWSIQIFILSSMPNPADILPSALVDFLWTTMIFGQRLFFLLGPVGHLINFGVLAFLLLRALTWQKPVYRYHITFAFILSFLYGISDEIHQLFVPSRAFQLRDMLINGLGALIGLAVYTWYDKTKIRRSQREALLL